MGDYGEFVGTQPVAGPLRFDVAALERYLTAHVAGFAGPLDVEQFKGGQSNPTYKLTAGQASYVLRRKPPGKLLPSAHAIDREFRVIRALAGSGVPVARTHCLCLDETVIGTPFYLMDFVDGRVFWDPRLPGMTPAERRAIYAEMNRVIAALHRIDFTAIGLADLGRPGNYRARQIDRWSRQYQASATEPLEAMDRLIDWLPRHIPAGERTSLVHGDFRLDNMIFDRSEPRVLAVLDWELSTLGDPLADFAYHLMTWRLAPDEFRGLRGCDFAALGIPAEGEYVAMYLGANPTLERPAEQAWDFYMAYSMFRMAGILQGILARSLAGNAASAQALEAGRRARPLAERAWKEVESGRAPEPRGR